MSETPTLAHATEFIVSHATDDDLARVVAAVKQRGKVLAAIRAAAVTVGSAVELRKLTPRHLNGLTGTVVRIEGRHGTVRLDADSTVRLRASQSRISIPADQPSYDLSGVPLDSCFPADAGQPSASS